MSIFITREVYSCTHSLDRRHRTLGTDDGVEIEIVPIPSQCPACVYDSLLEGCIELDENNKRDYSTLDQTATNEERVGEFAKYLQELLEKKRCALMAVYGAGFVPEF
ncbi:uncharacterized protein GGS22DRAFT_190358 [Annulohypoxylon maeteangense]|uniref:uncharacterized protein n=1 Tax=Annulohypoxylon maeteangense TaxID=1927788 RepID=UPI00200746A5|nr:uncharacterized protein GGS22DRAFT_190358 [Annulohypoxylon maeteangense]KAI0883050.1 hypothetical protein GGS22DRAFT_190358 [Annulohypoxylon maeteangense]